MNILFKNKKDDYKNLKETICYDLIDQIHFNIKKKIKNFLDMSYKEDIENLEILFRILKEK